MVVCLRGKRMPIPGQSPAALVPLALATLVPTVLVVEPGGRWPPSRLGWVRLIWAGVLMRSWLS